MRIRKKSRSRLLYGGVAAAILLGGAWYVWNISASDDGLLILSEKNSYPVQYSDAHITKNAIAADPRFEKIALIDRESLLASVFNALESRAPSRESQEPERGTWLWTPVLEITPEYRRTIIAAAKGAGIRNIYLSIDSYLDIYVLPEGSAKETKLKAFDAAVEAFIKEARENGITVDAEGGWRNWAEEGHIYKPLAVLNYAVRFNETHEEKLRGFQYDVEPYLLEEYESDRKAVLANFLDLMGQSLVKLSESDMLFTVVIPDFYDGRQNITPEFFYGWRYGHTLDHLLALLERRPGSQIIVMSYRNQSEGEDGSIAISRDEITRANRFKTKIVLAQETGEVSPSSITFYNTSRTRLERELELLNKAFEGEKSYGGLAIHYMNALMALPR